MDVVCPFCRSLSFKNETDFNCCQNGKVAYDPPTDFPTELQALYLQDTPEAKNVRKYIRKYNKLFAFASTKMTPAKNLPVTKFGTGVIRISGQMFHKTGNLYTSLDQNGPMYNQFYIYDGEEALQHRTASLLYDVTLSARATHVIQQTMDNYNPFAHSYRHLHEVEQEERVRAEAEGRVPKEYKMYFHEKNSPSHTKNKPLHNEVAAFQRMFQYGLQLGE